MCMPCRFPGWEQLLQVLHDCSSLRNRHNVLADGRPQLSIVPMLAKMLLKLGIRACKVVYLVMQLVHLPLHLVRLRRARH
eukprot:CAMPEP_0183333088 /NCGR_PEP_ID=MMETSP0164_2-20130417/2070_1 /TAXON_ID=221442 /ORGANISM="Coccolithus pelagicus ssp braarudi, Strain PLY182g" /LENGTH=79 /DNA_ID=CAMNT_0025501919 /DNA_START=504 /DNA_END=743 /DNA_ORIENTATION=+